MTTIAWVILAVAAAVILLMAVRERNINKQLVRAREAAETYQERWHDERVALEDWRDRALNAEELVVELKAKDALNVEEETYLQESYGLPERPEL